MGDRSHDETYDGVEMLVRELNSRFVMIHMRQVVDDESMAACNILTLSSIFMVAE